MEPPKRKPKFRLCRLFRCFKPNGVVSREPKKPDPLLTYIPEPEKQPFPVVFTSAFTAGKGGEGNASHRKNTDTDNNNNNNNCSNNFLRRFLMATLNHTPLAKKISNKKIKKDSFSRESSISSSNFSCYSRSSLGFTPTSSSSSISTNLSSSSKGSMNSSSSCEPHLTRSLAMSNGTRVMKQKQNDGDGRRWYCGSNMAVSLFLITSLLVLILWGRFCAIAYTSIGFFVVPNRRRRTCEEFCSVRYKK